MTTKEWLGLTLMVFAFAFLWWNEKKIKQSEREFDQILAESRFYEVKACQHCGAKLRIAVGRKRGEFLKECPEGCETHFLKLPVERPSWLRYYCYKIKRIPNGNGILGKDQINEAIDLIKKHGR